MTVQNPPGIEFSWSQIVAFMRTLKEYDPLEFTHQMAETYGGFMRNKFGLIEIYLITDPDLAHEVLIERHDEFYKGTIFNRAIRPFLGNGLLTNEGDFWKRQRKMMQPMFHSKRIASYADAMTHYTQELIVSWKTGDTRWIDRDMMKVTLSVVNKTLFDVEISAQAEQLNGVFAELLDTINSNINAIVALPAWIPTPKRARQKQVLAQIDTLIQGMIDERRANPDEREDLLSLLLHAQDDEGSGMTDQQLRDEVVTLFFAGHETTSNTLTWAFYLLSQAPQVMQKLQQELDTVLQGRTPTMQDLPQLTYTEQIIKETLRLYPSAPGLSRSPIQDLELGGYPIKKDAVMQIGLYAMHRSSRLWENPLAFNPERFAPENESRIPKHAYLPFGAGPRVCIGNQFAMMEAKLILATIAQHFELSVAPEHPVVAEQLVTVRAKHGMKMVVKARETVKASLS